MEGPCLFWPWNRWSPGRHLLGAEASVHLLYGETPLYRGTPFGCVWITPSTSRWSKNSSKVFPCAVNLLQLLGAAFFRDSWIHCKLWYLFRICLRGKSELWCVKQERVWMSAQPGLLSSWWVPVALYNCKNDQHPLIDHEHFSCCSLVCTKMQK